jgi:PAS domain S-box-containing protein
MLVVDGEGSILFANRESERLFGQLRSALTGTRLEQLLVPECRSPFWNELARLSAAPLAPDPPARVELVAIGPDEGLFPAEFSLRQLDTGYAPMTVVVIRDISSQRFAEAQQSVAEGMARAAHERLEVLLEYAPAVIMGLSEQGTIDFINRTLPQHPRSEVIGSSWLRYIPEDLKERMQAALRSAYETGSTQTFETTTAGPEGAMLWFESQIAPIYTGGQIAGAVVVSQDVTERKRAQSELLVGRHMALLGTLAAGVAHEINTPVQFVGDSIHFLRDAARSLVALLETLQELRRAALEGTPLGQAVAAAAAAEEQADLPFLREQMPVAFERCVEGLSQVATIVRSLKEFAHPSQREMVPADLNRAIRNSLTIATGEYKYVANLETDFGELPPVTCHVSEIGQAVLNLVVNAAHSIGEVVKGSDRKGLISVRTRCVGDSVLIAISDTGAGIPENVRSRIFDPFFTTKEVGKGTGQGLAIAWSTVKERHGGTISFETRVGEGTTFSIRLPISGRGTPGVIAEAAHSQALSEAMADSMSTSDDVARSVEREPSLCANETVAP